MSIQHTRAAAQTHRPAFLVRVLRHIKVALAVRDHRNALRKLDSHLLQDIGLTRELADAEIARPIWDVPAHWRR